MGGILYSFCRVFLGSHVTVCLCWPLIHDQQLFSQPFHTDHRPTSIDSQPTADDPRRDAHRVRAPRTELDEGVGALALRDVRAVQLRELLVQVL